MILYLFVGIVTAIFSSLFFHFHHHQKTLILSQIFISSSLLTFYIHHYVLDESMTSLHCLYQSFLSSSVSSK